MLWTPTGGRYDISDPACHLLTSDLQTKSVDEAGNENALPAVNLVPVTPGVSSVASDDYYQTVVINALLGILKDQSLSNHHHTVIEAIMSIFKTQGLKCVTFLPQVTELLDDACTQLTTYRLFLPLLLLPDQPRQHVSRSSISSNLLSLSALSSNMFGTTPHRFLVLSPIYGTTRHCNCPLSHSSKHWAELSTLNLSLSYRGFCLLCLRSLKGS